MSLVKQISGIPAPIDGAYVLVLTVTFTAQTDVGSDWGASSNARLFKTQNSSTTYADSVKLSTSRLPFTLQEVFSLSSGFTITCGLDVLLSGPTSVDFWDVKVEAVIVKR